MQIEARRLPRTIMRRVIKVTAASKSYYAETLNLSVNGAFIKGRFPWQPGDRLHFRFFVDELRLWIEGEAKISWNQKGGKSRHLPNGIGVEFVSLLRDGRFILKQLLSVEQGMSLIAKLENKHQRDRIRQLNVEKTN